MSKKSNIAYDFSLFEPTEKEKNKSSVSSKNKKNVVKLKEEQLYKSQRRKYKPLTVISTILFSFVVLTIISTVITSQIELTELCETINKSQKQLAEQQSISTQLEMKIESKLSLSQVESYAKDVLGMQPIQSYQIEYINMANGDKSEIKTESPKSWLETISEAVLGLLS